MSYRLVFADREVALRPGENLLGRVDDLRGLDRVADRVPSPRSDHRGAEGRAILEDLDSKNGTFVGGERISSPTPLAHGDVIRLGRISVRIHAGRADQSTLSPVD